MNDLTQTRQDDLIPFEESQAWQRAYAVWLSGKRQHTRRAYSRIVQDFLQFVNVPPAEVTGDMVNAWKLHLQALGRKDTTIAQRLAGLSSFFDHLQRKANLIDRNPVDMCERGDLNDSPYGNARPIFIGERVFALLGYELVEGGFERDRIRERRRVDFSPGQVIAR